MTTKTDEEVLAEALLMRLLEKASLPELTASIKSKAEFGDAIICELADAKIETEEEFVDCLESLNHADKSFQDIRDLVAAVEDLTNTLLMAKEQLLGLVATYKSEHPLN